MLKKQIIIVYGLLDFTWIEKKKGCNKAIIIEHLHTYDRFF